VAEVERGRSLGSDDGSLRYRKLDPEIWRSLSLCAGRRASRGRNSFCKRGCLADDDYCGMLYARTKNMISASNVSVVNFWPSKALTHGPCTPPHNACFCESEHT